MQWTEEHVECDHCRNRVRKSDAVGWIHVNVITEGVDKYRFHDDSPSEILNGDYCCSEHLLFRLTRWMLSVGQSANLSEKNSPIQFKLHAG